LRCSLLQPARRPAGKAWPSLRGSQRGESTSRVCRLCPDLARRARERPKARTTRRSRRWPDGWQSPASLRRRRVGCPSLTSQPATLPPSACSPASGKLGGTVWVMTSISPSSRPVCRSSATWRHGRRHAIGRHGECRIRRTRRSCRSRHSRRPTDGWWLRARRRTCGDASVPRSNVRISPPTSVSQPSQPENCSPFFE
jgi:hypothetical protein